MVGSELGVPVESETGSPSHALGPSALEQPSESATTTMSTGAVEGAIRSGYSRALGDATAESVSGCPPWYALPAQPPEKAARFFGEPRAPRFEDRVQRGMGLREDPWQAARRRRAPSTCETSNVNITLDHIGIVTRDVAATTDFYVRLLDGELLPTPLAGHTMIRAGDVHLAIVAWRDGDPDTFAWGQHVALRVAGEHRETVLARLAELAPPHEHVRDRVYVRDPGGFTLELLFG